MAALMICEAVVFAPGIWKQQDNSSEGVISLSGRSGGREVILSRGAGVRLGSSSQKW